MAFPRYETYKDSGLPWLGQIPAHWGLKKSKFLWRELEDRSITGDEQLLSVSQYYGVIPKEDDSRSESLVDYKRCRKQDLVVNIMLAWMSGLGVTDHDGIVSPAYCVYRQLEDHNSKYLNYLYRTPLYLAEFAKKSKGIVPSRWRMYTEDFGQVFSLLPLRDEQDRIAKFLDQKNSEIDDAIAKKQRLIDLLKEQKAILINQAVTKGLNPDIPLRDSGVDWIGEIPEHWTIKKNRELFTERKESGSESLPILTVSLHTGVSDNEQDETENIRSKIRIEDKTCYRRVYPGDIAFNMMRAWQGAIGVVKTDGQVSPAYIIASPCSLIDGEYFEYQYRTSVFIGQMDRSSKGITDFRKRLYWAEFKQLSTIVPPLDEQKKIVETIREISKATDNVVESVVREIEQLKELRSVLIAEVVTGKIKI